MTEAWMSKDTDIVGRGWLMFSIFQIETSRANLNISIALQWLLGLMEVGVKGYMIDDIHFILQNMYIRVQYFILVHITKLNQEFYKGGYKQSGLRVWP